MAREVLWVVLIVKGRLNRGEDKGVIKWAVCNENRTVFTFHALITEGCLSSNDDGHFRRYNHKAIPNCSDVSIILALYSHNAAKFITLAPTKRSTIDPSLAESRVFRNSFVLYSRSLIIVNRIVNCVFWEDSSCIATLSLSVAKCIAF
jgi:hypothetical protein